MYFDIKCNASLHAQLLVHLLQSHLVQPDLLVHFLHFLFESAQLLLFILHLDQVRVDALVMHGFVCALLIRNELIFPVNCLQAVVIVLLDEILLEIVYLDDVLERLGRRRVLPVALELGLFAYLE